MADETAPKEESKTVFDQVTSAVDAAVADGSPTLKDRVVRKLADEELTKRSDLLLSGIRKFSEFKAELAKLKQEFAKVNKPDVFANELGADGKFSRTGKFSDAKVKEIEEATKKTKKAEEEVNAKMKKLEGALSKAVNESDYVVLKKVVGGKSDEAEEKAAE